MNKYKNSKIYKITSLQTEKIYIGSTIQSLGKRLSSHKTQYKRFLLGNKNYLSSFEIIKYLDPRIELIKKCSCNSRKELLLEELKEIRNNNNCVNIVYNDKKEIFNKNRLETHKEHLEDLFSRETNNINIQEEDEEVIILKPLYDEELDLFLQDVKTVN